MLNISRKINSELNLDLLLETILDSIRSVIPYDKGAIFLLNQPSKNIVRMARRGPKPLFDENEFIKKGEGLVAWALKNKQPVISDNVDADRRYFPIYLDTRSEMDVPIFFKNKLLGIINLESNTPARFSKRHLRMVMDMVNQAAVAIENAWLYKQLSEKRELVRELRLAKKFQKALLPRRMPQVDDYSFAAMNIPSRMIGGDLFDFIKFSDYRIGICVGDVSGKGTPGAILMATLFSMYRGLVRLGLPLEKMMTNLNNMLKKRISTSSFITFFYGELMTVTGEIIYINAGHCPPILIRKSGKTELLEKGGTVLGFVQDAAYDVGKISLESGDMLILFTDGVTEAMNDRDELFGEAALVDVARKNRSERARIILKRIFQAIQKHTDLPRPQDDFTAVIIKKR